MANQYNNYVEQLSLLLTTSEPTESILSTFIPSSVPTSIATSVPSSLTTSVPTSIATSVPTSVATSIVTTLMPTLMPTTWMPINLLQNQIVERIEDSTIWSIVVVLSVASSLATTVCVLGASAYCNYLRSHYRRKYLNSIASSGSYSDSSGREEDESSSGNSSVSSITEEDEEEQPSSQHLQPKKLNRDYFPEFTFDQIYRREDIV